MKGLIAGFLAGVAVASGTVAAQAVQGGNPCHRPVHADRLGQALYEQLFDGHIAPQAPAVIVVKNHGQFVVANGAAPPWITVEHRAQYDQAALAVVNELCY